MISRLAQSFFGKFFGRTVGAGASVAVVGTGLVQKAVSTPSPFDPSAVFSPNVWVDGTDNASITITGSGVSRWADKSGKVAAGFGGAVGSQDSNFIQVTDADRPTVANNDFGVQGVLFSPGQWLLSVWTVYPYTIPLNTSHEGLQAGCFSMAAGAGGGQYWECNGYAGSFSVPIGFTPNHTFDWQPMDGSATVSFSIYTPPLSMSVYRTNPSFVDPTASYKLVYYVNVHADGTNTVGYAFYTPRANKLSFCIFTEGPLSPVLQFDKRNNGFQSQVTLNKGDDFIGGTDCLIHEIISSVNAQADGDCHAYMLSRFGSMIAPGIADFVNFFGDSITFGFGNTEADSYPFVVMNTIGSGVNADYMNLGVSGRSVLQMLGDVTAYKQLFRPFKQNVMVIFMGINDDMSTVGSHNTVLANLWTVCDGLRNQGYKILVLTIIPAPNAGNNIYDSERVLYNAAIMSGFAAHADAAIDLTLLSEFNSWGNGAPSFINMGGTFQNGGSFENMTYYQSDNVHPTAAGLAIIANAVQSTIISLLTP